MAFQVLAISDSMATQGREKLASPQYGHPAHVEVATGTGPCRSCLRTFEVGQEERILFTYNPFEGLDAYPSPGLVFVHRTACEPFRGEGFPETLKSLPLTLEAYGEDRWIVDRVRVTDGKVDVVQYNLIVLRHRNVTQFYKKGQFIHNEMLRNGNLF